jgi:hypothetical protein
MEAMMDVIQWSMIGLFIAVAALGLASHCLLIRWTDWSTMPDSVYKFTYLGFGFWSPSMLRKHVQQRRLQTLLFVRKTYIAIFSLALVLVVLNFVLLATWQW